MERPERVLTGQEAVAPEEGQQPEEEPWQELARVRSHQSREDPPLVVLEEQQRVELQQEVQEYLHC